MSLIWDEPKPPVHCPECGRFMRRIVTHDPAGNWVRTVWACTRHTTGDTPDTL